MYLPALPQMMSDLALSTQQVQLTLTTWFLGSACMPLIMGVISDRYGRRRVLLLGGLVYILSTLVCAATPSLYVLLSARVIQGSMVASVLVAGYACIHELYEQKEAIRILAWMGSISVLAPAFGPLFGSIVLYFVNWRGIFWIIALWATIAILLLQRFMPETLPKEKRHPIHLGILFTHYWHIVTNKKFIFLMLTLGFIFCGFLAWITAGPLLLIESFHYSAIYFGIVQAIIFIAYIYGNRWVNYFLEKLGVISLIHLGLGITLSGGILILLSGLYFPNTLYPFFLSMMIYSFGSALCFAPLNRSIIETSDEPMGIRVALFTVFLTGFAALGSGLSSLFFNGTILSLSYIIAISVFLSCLMKWLAV
jgi:DHA1 family multidrug/chloramphenicol efflux transport protein-like MFS transporter